MQLDCPILRGLSSFSVFFIGSCNCIIIIDIILYRYHHFQEVEGGGVAVWDGGRIRIIERLHTLISITVCMYDSHTPVVKLFTSNW